MYGNEGIVDFSKAPHKDLQFVIPFSMVVTWLKPISLVDRLGLSEEDCGEEHPTQPPTNTQTQKVGKIVMSSSNMVNLMLIKVDWLKQILLLH